MSWFKDLFNSGVTDVMKAADNLFTSDKERGEIKIELKKVLQNFKVKMLEAQAKYDQEITQRWKSDNEHGITRLVRPVSYGFVLILFAGLVLFDGNIGGFVINKAYIPVIQGLLYTMTIAYFGSRGIEKVAKSINKKKENTQWIHSLNTLFLPCKA